MILEPGVLFAQRYRIKRRLGAGAAATVWLAVDESLGRQVALKIFDADHDASDTLLEEARTVAGFNHPHIVTLYDAGTSEGHVYFVTEYVDGEDLKSYLSRFAHLTVEKAASLILHVARGVAVAHRRGLVHRDLKPGNVLISRDGIATVTDFGIARMVGEDIAGTERLVYGTPAYIAPEQARGEPATPASDVYSLGIIFFEMLAGQPPFEADSPMELVRAHIETPAPKVTEFNKRVPPRLASFIGQLLAKDAHERPTDAGEVVAWLEAYIAASSTHTRAIPTQSERSTPAAVATDAPSAEPTDDNAGIWTCLSLGLIGLLALGIVVVGYWLFLRPPELPSVAREEDAPATIASTATPAPATPTEAAQTETTATAVQNSPTPTLSAATATSTIDVSVRRDGPSVPALPMNDAEFSLDGELSEWNRDGIPLMHLHFRPENWTDESDLSGTGWLAWNTSHLMVAVRVRDDTHVQTQSGWDMFRGDSVELWLDTDLAGDFDTREGNADDWQFGFSPGNFQDLPPEGVVYVPVRDSGLNERIEVQAQPASDGYTLEARIPWNAINVDARSGMVLGYALDLSDNDQPGTAQQQTQVASVPNLEWNVPTTFGNLVLR